MFRFGKRGTGMTYEIAIRARQAEKLVGMKVATDMEHAMADCPRLWMEVFGPRMAEIDSGGSGHSYGISVATDPVSFAFDYWAAMPLAVDAAIPDGMATLELPAGLYAECKVPTLANLGGAYMYLYNEWLPAQQEYRVNMAGLCYEYYIPNYEDTDPLFIYLPITKA